jgi:hypothetical protein
MPPHRPYPEGSRPAGHAPQAQIDVARLPMAADGRDEWRKGLRLPRRTRYLSSQCARRRAA